MSRSPICFSLPGKMPDIAKDRDFEGPPDLVVEILSPSSIRRDRYEKQDQYARFGVKEYWIVDPVKSLPRNPYPSGHSDSLSIRSAVGNRPGGLEGTGTGLSRGREAKLF